MVRHKNLVYFKNKGKFDDKYNCSFSQLLDSRFIVIWFSKFLAAPIPSKLCVRSHARLDISEIAFCTSSKCITLSRNHPGYIRSVYFSCSLFLFLFLFFLFSSTWLGWVFPLSYGETMPAMQRKATKDNNKKKIEVGTDETKTTKSFLYIR